MLRTAFSYLLRSTYDGIITLDGEGQYDPDDIPTLIRAGELQHAGMVIGNRLAQTNTLSSLDRSLSRVVSSLISRMSRQQVPDALCAFRLIRRELLASVPLKAAHTDIETELLLAASRQRWKTISIPVHSHPIRMSVCRLMGESVRVLRALLHSL